MVSKERIAASVVLYNPNIEIIKNIDSYQSFVEKIYLIDNSEVANFEIVNRLKENQKVFYIANCGNKGIGNALNKACVNAIEDGFDWLLTMDQDSSFEGHEFFNEFIKYSRKSTVAIFSPNQLLLNESVEPKEAVSSEVIIMTSGNLVNLTLYNVIGGFNEQLFIDEVDHEYCLRAKQLKFDILKFKNIEMNHHLGEAMGKKRKDGSIINQHSPIRMYYITRNNLYIFKAYFFKFPTTILKRIINLILLYKEVVFYQEQRFLKAKYIRLGIYHFLIGRYGKL